MTTSKRPSMRAAINAMCRQCIYDPKGSGTWRQQVEACTAALEAAQMGLRYAVRVWVLSDEIAWSEEEIDETVERIIGDAKKEAGND